MIEIDAEAIAWLSLPRSSATEAPLLPELLRQLDEALGEVEATGRATRALVIRGSHPGDFISISAPTAAEAHRDPEGATQLLREGQRVLRRLERLPIPTAAAIDGACFAFGAALSLACSYRIASDAAHTRVGFPEIRLGLLPGLGASVRLPRLTGLQAALELVLGGRVLSGREAREVGLVDEVYPPRDFAERVRGFVLERLERGRIRTGARRRVARRLLEDTAPGRRVVLGRAARGLLPRVAFAAPTPQRVLELMGESVVLPLERAFERETEVLGELLASDRALALRHAARVVRSAAPAVPEHPVEQVGVLGAGGTGSDLAYLLASAGIPVRLKDVRRDALTGGVQRALRHLALDVQAGRITEAQADERAGRISAVSGYGGFGTLDLVIVAVGEEEEAVRAALAQAAEHTRSDCVLALAAAGLSAARVLTGLPLAQRMVALRPCAPSDRFPVLEVVPGEAGDEAVAASVALARRLGRVPLVVADLPGGLTNRLLAAYLAEALRLVDEGATVLQVDGAAESFGFSLGPFRRMDAMGLDRVARLLQRLAAELGDRFRPTPLLERIRASGQDFHLRRGGKPAGTNPVLPAGIPGDRSAELIRQRLLLLLVNEAALALEDGVVGSPAEIDAASLLGLGFPRAQGGLLYHAEQTGLGEAVALLHDRARRFGAHFAPAPLLQRFAAEGTGFSGQPRSGML